jgi:hypothetical protein
VHGDFEESAVKPGEELMSMRTSAFERTMGGASTSQLPSAV